MQQKSGNESHITLRAYGYLNHCLKANYRYRRFSYTAKGHPAIKDTIEALGIPHTEVDVILCNGRAVGFYYQLREKDCFEIYPPRHPLTNSLKSRVFHLQKYRSRFTQFVADGHLGKLVKYLRLLGVDVAYKNNFPDREIIKTAIEENRIVLTRDRGILKNKIIPKGCLIRSTNPWQQVKEVTERFNLTKRTRPFTRCLECNGLIKKTAKKRIANLIPPKTYSYYSDFYQCQKCQKIYWHGTHYEKLKKKVRKLSLQIDPLKNSTKPQHP